MYYFTLIRNKAHLNTREGPRWGSPSVTKSVGFSPPSYTDETKSMRPVHSHSVYFGGLSLTDTYRSKPDVKRDQADLLLCFRERGSGCGFSTTRGGERDTTRDIFQTDRQKIFVSWRMQPVLQPLLCACCVCCVITAGLHFAVLTANTSSALSADLTLCLWCSHVEKFLTANQKHWVHIKQNTWENIQRGSTSEPVPTCLVSVSKHKTTKSRNVQCSCNVASSFVWQNVLLTHPKGNMWGFICTREWCWCV